MRAGSFGIARMDRYNASVASRDSLKGSWLFMSSSSKTRSASSGIVSLKQYCMHELYQRWYVGTIGQYRLTEKYHAVVAGMQESRLSSCCCCGKLSKNHCCIRLYLQQRHSISLSMSGGELFPVALAYSCRLSVARVRRVPTIAS